jgi:hypothetical protein
VNRNVFFTGEVYFKKNFMMFFGIGITEKKAIQMKAKWVDCIVFQEI